MPDSQPTLAFIYDRHISPTKGLLELRLGLCREYAAERRWEIAGEWVDEGDAALEDNGRPKFGELVLALEEAHDAGRTVVCLVADWFRISHDSQASSRLRYKIAQAGGWTVTVGGEDDRTGLTRETIEALRHLRLA